MSLLCSLILMVHMGDRTQAVVKMTLKWPYRDCIYAAWFCCTNNFWGAGMDNVIFYSTPAHHKCHLQIGLLPNLSAAIYFIQGDTLHCAKQEALPLYFPPSFCSRFAAASVIGLSKWNSVLTLDIQNVPSLKHRRNCTFF